VPFAVPSRSDRGLSPSPLGHPSGECSLRNAGETKVQTRLSVLMSPHRHTIAMSEREIEIEKYGPLIHC
jgi:hypothetical protein